MKKIAWYGDSTTIGLTGLAGAQTVTANNEVFFATEMLNKWLGSGSVESENLGVGGTNILDWWSGNSNHGMPHWLDRMPAAKLAGFDIVILKVGINDAFLPSITPEIFRDCVAAMKNAANANGMQFVFCAPNPINHPHNTRLWSLINQARTAGARVIDHYYMVSTMPDWPLFLPDAIHPDENLYEVMGSLSAAGLRPII